MFLLGTGAFVLNLSYLVRKRLARVAWLGSLRAWMTSHVVTGILGVVALGLTLFPLEWAAGLLGAMVLAALATGIWLKTIDMSL